MAKKVKRKQELELEIEKVAFGGKGIARLDDYVIFVDNSLPGDRVNARIRKAKQKYAEAYPLELLKSSQLRQEAPCKHFGWCGGCKWQNVDYPQQLAFKKQHVAEALAHIGGVTTDALHDVLPAPAIFGYRNKMEFSFSANRWLLPEELGDPEIKKDFALGLHVPRYFDRIVDIEKCWIQPEMMNEILRFSKAFFRDSGVPVYHQREHHGVLRHLVLRKSFAAGKLMINLVTSRTIDDVMTKYVEKLTTEFPFVSSIYNTINSGVAQVATGEEQYLIHGEAVLVEQLEKFKFEISPNSFFQTNSIQGENLYKVVRKFADVADKNIWDLYCGTGSIGIFVAENARKITGFEIVESAVKDAYRNAELNGIKNCEFVAGDLRFNLRKYAEDPPDVIICDPPRAGMHKDVVKTLMEVAPPQIVYVSCNPATMARDLAELTQIYHIAEVQPVDMFPHTYHIESVARLEKIA